MRIVSLTTAAAAVLAITTLAPVAVEAAPITVVASVSGAAIAGSGAALGDYDVFLEFDPQLTVQSVTFGTQLNLGNPFDSIQFEDGGSAGVLEVLEVSLLDLGTLMTAQADAFPLFTVLFDSGSLSSSAALASIHFGTVLLGDGIGNILAPGLLTLSSPNQVPVPEPASAMLLAAGLGTALARVRRRNDKR